VQAAADTYQAERRANVDQYAAALRSDAESFADRTLADLVAVLQQAVETAQEGRQALAERGEPGTPHPLPDGGQDAESHVSS
jgi:hypothetical protein